MAIVVEETIGIDGLVATVGDNIDELYSMATKNKKDIKKLKRDSRALHALLWKFGRKRI